ncbi:GHKL domain-containing protein [Brevibacillus fluminis]|uniref:histidine kinase n=1 Tax=Brevibacillus fluminis TaxID=511487 RepID=A0A3M8DF64_9BACL|nr:histidine kinase N-terminal domain-containing protein [Brevibacillus fluminis]RNB85975.1 GHKL domain-containing protein [Brevibacillus fluminis]
MITEEFARFLEESQDCLIREFRKSVILSEWDLSHEAMSQNIVAMLHLVIGYVMDKNTLEDVTQLAHKVAVERIQAKSNIGDFVHNVSLGRQVLFQHIYQNDACVNWGFEPLTKISNCFDHFLTQTVTRYNDLKNTDLEEKQLFIDQTHKERLTILAQMSASFVHEFRNPLTSVMGFTKLLMQEKPDLPYLDIMMNELELLNYRVTQFLLVSKKGHSMQMKGPILLVDLFEETLAFLYPQIVDVNVDIETQIDPGLRMVGYREEIRQVFSNIIINAIDAVLKRNGERMVWIDVKREKEDIVISIANNGQPIPQDLLPVIFEPFVTTKELGTGIGLYICKQMIVRHEGTITCTSDESLTTFTIRFPLPQHETDEEERK